MTVLPQYQGDYYTLQNKQALAQALMQQALQPQQIQATGSGPYTVMPKYSMGAGIAQLGQALLAAKMQQQASQGLSGLGQAQWASLAGVPQQAQQQPQASSDVGGSADGTQQSGTVPNPFQGGASNPQALAGALGASGGAAPQQPPQQAPQQTPQQQGGGMLAPGGALNPSGMDQGKAAYLYMTMGPTEYAKNFVAPYVKPTDATLMARQAGVDPAAANQGALFKNNYVAPITGTGTFRNPQTMQPMAFNPDVPAGSTPLFDASGNVAAVKPIQGAQGVMQGNAAATAAGGAQFKPVQVYNPQTQQMEYSNEAAVTNPGAPAGVRNNNPGAMMPGGKLAQYPDMQTGLQALDVNLASYGKQGVNTISGVISKWAPPNENDTQAYIKDVSQRLGIPANQKIDLSNPLQRQALSTAIALHENGPQGVFGGGGSGAPAAAPPLGAQAAAEAQQKGQIDTMQKSYQNLQTVRSGAPAALQDVDNMSKLAQGANPLTIGPAGAKFAGLFSANAAEYEKSRDNLVTNLGSQLGINSDAARDLVYGSIPSYGAPKQAVQNGLQTLRGQIQTRLLKSDYLSDAYAAGDAKAYNQRENQFDQNVTPAIANVVSMPPSPERAAALKQAAANPQMRARLEWAAQNGVLK
jgi:hypothetical protein